MKRILGALLATIGISIASSATAGNIADVGRLLTQAPLVCGTFTQTKFLTALTRPLVSEGRMIFASGAGILWKIKSPFPSQVLVKADALIRWNDNNVPQRTGFGQSPEFRALADVFFAVFAGNTEGLATAFHTSATVGPKSWALNLKPRDSRFAARIAKIEVSGGRFVREFRIVEGQGDRTEIRFKDLTAVDCVVTNAEKEFLAQ